MSVSLNPYLPEVQGQISCLYRSLFYWFKGEERPTRDWWQLVISERHFPLWFCSGMCSGQRSCLLEVMAAYVVDSIEAPNLGGETVPFHLDPWNPRSRWCIINSPPETKAADTNSILREFISLPGLWAQGSLHIKVSTLPQSYSPSPM